MADTPESKSKRRIRGVLDAYGLRYSMNTTGGYGRSGDLDFTVNAWGYYLVIEAKSVFSEYGKRGPTALQWDTIDEVVRGGGVALVIDENTFENLHEVLTVLGAQEPPLTARGIAHQNHCKYERPNLTPATATKPTLRKKKAK